LAPNTHRLPATVVPQKYTLTLRPDLEKLTFHGEEAIDVRVRSPVRRISLNASELQVQGASVSPAKGAAQTAKVSLEPKAQRVHLTFPRPVPKGDATLRLTFTGTLNDQLAGFYRSKYAMADGTTGIMAATQFEATDARRAFPCWDEPEWKATFQLSLHVPDGWAAVSNTPIAEDAKLRGGGRLVRFAETPRMSTYLLAFVLGPLASLEGKSRTGTRVGVWALPDRIQHGRWALDEASRILDYLNEYYGIRYPLPKIDHLALQDFAAGAMENWGAVTYREQALLFDPATSSALTRQRIVSIIAHETAHMWFGDLVTMAWWDDLWLNESFASWMGEKTVDALHPDWQMWTQFLYGDTVHGLDLDGLRSSHPIEVAVKDPAEVREIFDDISYAKGASTLRMLEQYLGEAVFRRGLQRYLKGHTYGNARTRDLWEALGAASRQPVRSLMDSWVKQTGFPLLDVTVTRKGGEATLSVSQSRFLYENLAGVRDAKTRWKVPVTVARSGQREPVRFLLAGKAASAPLGRSRAPAERDWVKVNAGQSGFYRVNYPAEEWARLRAAVVAGELGPRDRLGLQNDAYALMRAGHLPATTFLEVTSAYAGEDDATVWRTISESLDGFERLIADEPYREAFHAYAREVYALAARRAGWEARPGEGHLDAIRRMIVLTAMGHHGDRATLREAAARFGAYRRDPSRLHPDLRGVVFGHVAQEADEAAYEELWDLERKASLQEEKVRFLNALTRPRRKELLERTLRRSLTDEVRSQDAVGVIVGVAGNNAGTGRDLAWAFIEDNWTELYRRYAPSGFLIRRLVQVAEAFTSPARARQVAAFFRRQKAPEVARGVRQALEKVRVNARWLERNRGDLRKWFAARGRG
jgi:puromycin-sensitive aminopeptidase